MAKAKRVVNRKKAANARPAMLQPVPVTVVAYDFSDEALDQLIAIGVRTVERLTTKRPDLLKRYLDVVLSRGGFGL